MNGEATVAAGMTFGNYVIESALGQGGEGQVFLARDSLLGRRVALKLPASGRAGEVRGLEEARLCAKLEHPCILRTYHAFRHQGVWFVVYEYAGLGSVEARVAKLGPYPTIEALEVTVQAARALGYLHEEGFLHRDVKPQNLLFGREGYVKLADFGLALDLRSPAALSASRVGTPVFLAPELWCDERPSTASDVYSLGMCLYFMLTGNVAFPSADIDQLKHAHLHQEPPIPQRFPGGVSDLLYAMLAKDPLMRPSIAELLNQLAVLQQDPHATSTASMSGMRAARFSEPFVRDGLERAARRAAAEGPERFHLQQLVRYLEERCPSILLSSDDIDEMEALLRVVIAQARGRFQLLARVTETQSGADHLRTRALEPETPTFSSLAEACVQLDGQPPARVDGCALVVVTLPETMSRARLEELRAGMECATTHGLSVVFIAGRAYAQATDDENHVLRVLAPRRIELSGRRMGYRDFAGRLTCWLGAATGERFRCSPDALRALWHAYVEERLPWRRLAREAVLIAAAAQLPLLTSWAVMAASAQRHRMHELADVPAELRRRPALWPTREAAAQLAAWRRDQARAEGLMAIGQSGSSRTLEEETESSR